MTRIECCEYLRDLVVNSKEIPDEAKEELKHFLLKTSDMFKNRQAIDKLKKREYRKEKSNMTKDHILGIMPEEPATVDEIFNLVEDPFITHKQLAYWCTKLSKAGIIELHLVETYSKKDLKNIVVKKYCTVKPKKEERNEI